MFVKLDDYLTISCIFINRRLFYIQLDDYFTLKIQIKMKELISRCWSQESKDRPSFKEIFEELSNDFSYSIEDVDEDEINEYLLNLDEWKKEREKQKEEKNRKFKEDESNKLKEIENKKLQDEVNELKSELQKCQNLLKSFISSEKSI